MSNTELTRVLIDVHNKVATVMVSGDSAIIVGDTLKELRQLISALSSENEEVDKES